MKRSVLSLVLIVLCLLTIAQVPESFSYQVVVRDGASNDPLTNQNVSFRMSILKSSTSGESQYSELHIANTGALGIVNLVIGNGTGKTGDISTIDWGADTYYLKVEIDKTGGNTYSDMGTTQLLSVPYALYSKTSKKADELEMKFQMLKNTVIAGGMVTDVEGNSYNTIKIGNQLWMAENLKTTKFNDNADIPFITDNAEWSNLTTPGYCWNNNDQTAYGNIYGALYNWFTVATGKLCPANWHVPTYEELTTLITYLGGTLIAGGKLKEKGTLHWKSPNTGATNESGFTGLPGSLRFYTGEFVSEQGLACALWSSTPTTNSLAWQLNLHYNSTIAQPTNCYSLNQGQSVRCVKD